MFCNKPLPMSHDDIHRGYSLNLDQEERKVNKTQCG